MVKKKTHRLARRTLIYVVFCSSIFTILATGFQLYIDYRKDINAIHSDIEQIKKGHQPGIETSLYAYDEIQLDLQLQGALKFRDIVYLEIKDIVTDDVLQSVGDPDADKDIVYEIDLSYKEFKDDLIPLGRLAIVASLEGVIDRLLGRVMIILMSNLVKTFLASIFILIIIQWLITRHLGTMEEYAGQINLNFLDKPLALNRSRKAAAQPDELDIVVNSINEMRIRLQEDIKKKEQVEKALIESEEKYRNMVNNSQDLLYRTDQNGKITFVSPSVKNITGYSTEEVISKDLVQKFYLNPEEREALLSILSRDGYVNGLEVQLKKKDGTIWWASTNAVLCTDEDGNMVGVEGTTRDITDIKESEDIQQRARDELEEEVRIRTADLEKAKGEAEKANQLKSEFLANISHELRNPMHQILSYSASGIKKIEKPKEKLQHYFFQTRKAADRLMLLLNDLLDLSKMESGGMDYQMESCDLYQIVNDAVSEIKPTIDMKNLSLMIVEPSVPTKVQCDSFRIGQVVRNLLSNATKFTPDNKHIKIAFTQNELNVENNTVPSLQVSICDEGVGIPENETIFVFEKFIQSSKTKTGAGGTGLGLSISQEIIKTHNGKIWAENNPEVGATFSFQLPYEQKTD